MNQEWTLHIENIGKVTKADIRIAPLLFFIGDNNSGKSYLMTILWGILFLGKDLFPVRPTEGRSYKQCEKWLSEHLNQDCIIEPEVADLYIRWFNDLLNQNKRPFLYRLFNYTLTSGKIEIQNYVQKKNIKLTFPEGKRYKFYSGKYIKFPHQDSYTKDDLLRMNTYICWNLLMGDIAAPLYTPILRGRRNGEPVYFPASRTGFMLTYNQLLEQSIQANFAGMDNRAEGKLTLPYVDFLQLITKFETRKINKTNGDLIKFLMENMTEGSFRIEKTILPNFKYQPASETFDMPLHVTSSVITELAPLSLLLQSGIDFKTIIIEEPEAHLHPALQKKMAQFIIRLMNAGKTVWVTTHSDTILQHVNNMLKLTFNRKRVTLMQQFQYEREDLLQPEKIHMYQFLKQAQGKTKVEELYANKYGFVVPTFNDALEKILDEVYAFQEDEN